MAEIQPYRFHHPMLVKKAGPTAAVLFAELVNHGTFHADVDGWFWLTQERITELLGIGEKATLNALERLQQLDLLMIDTRGDKNRRHFKLVETAEDYLQAIGAEPTNSQFPPKEETSSAKRKERVPAFSGNEFLPKEETSSSVWQEQVPTFGGNYKKVIEERIIEEKVIEEKLIEEKTNARKRAGRVKKKKEENPLLEKLAIECIEHLNRTTGKRFQNGEHNVELYKRLLVDGYTQQDIFEVHELKWLQWKDREDMHEFLCPSTLVGPKNFKRYRQHVEDAKANPGKYFKATPEDKHRQQSIDRIQGFIAAGERLEARNNQSR